MSVLYIKDLIIEAKHGVHEHEKKNTQRFMVNVELEIDLSRAVQSDDLADALDWSSLRQEIISIVKNNSFNLIERLAQVIAEAMLRHSGVKKVNISIDKIDAFDSGIPGIQLSITGDH